LLLAMALSPFKDGYDKSNLDSYMV
jgi:hypothetical protein